MNKIKRFSIFSFLVFFISASLLEAQTFSDGPIRVQMRLKRVKVTPPPGANNEASDYTFDLSGIPGAPAVPATITFDEYSWYVWGLANSNVLGNTYATAGGGLGGACQQDGFRPPDNFNSIDFNQTFYDQTFPGPTVPQFMDLKFFGFEDDLPSDWNLLIDPLVPAVPPFTPAIDNDCNDDNGYQRCDWDSSQCVDYVIGTFDDGDDWKCDAEPYATNLDYRVGPPCQWNYLMNNATTFLTGTCPDGVFEIEVQAYYEFLNGDNCAAPIALGNFSAGQADISHYNSSACYSNLFTSANGGDDSPDVYYTIDVTTPVGVKISTCGGATNFDTQIHLFDGCGGALLEFDDEACPPQSEFSYALCTPGTYVIIVEGQAGANGEFTLNISEDTTVMVKSVAWSSPFSPASCDGDSIQIGGVPAAVGGTGPFEYSWSPVTGDPLVDSIPNPTILPPADQVYTLTVTDALGCTSSNSVLVSVDTIPIVNFGGDQSMCVGETMTLDAGPSVGSNYTNYVWLPSVPGPDTSRVIDVTNFGLYVVIVFDGNGCRGVGSVNVLESPGPSLNLGENNMSICPGDSIVLDAGAGYLYSWNGVPGGSQFYTVNSAGVYEVEISDPVLVNCVSRDTVTVSVDPIPSVLMNFTSISICEGTDVILDPGPQYLDYLWTDSGAFVSNNQYLQVDEPGEYVVEVSDPSTGCVNSTSGIVMVTPVNEFLLPDTSTLCLGDTLELVDLNAGFSSYNWSTGSLSSTTQVTSGGTYWGIGTDMNGCSDSDTTFILIKAVDDLQLSVPTVICPGDSISMAPLLAGFDYDSYEWSGDTVYYAADLVIIGPGTYTVAGTKNNCTSTFSFTMLKCDDPNVSGSGGPLFIPNVFSPNEDGIADEFIVSGENIDEVEVGIFDRWGNVLYEIGTTDVNNISWNGKMNNTGAEMKPGPYFYNIKYLIGEKWYSESGNITLIK